MINPDYKLMYSETNNVSETGSLIIFKIESMKNEAPCFIGRWDQNYATLDIDILKVGKKFISCFKSEKNGYSGHHPRRISETTLTYKVDIKIPDKEVFAGNITFNLNHGHEPGLFG